jgi:hypothetical protein
VFVRIIRLHHTVCIFFSTVSMGSELCFPCECKSLGLQSLGLQAFFQTYSSSSVLYFSQQGKSKTEG